MAADRFFATTQDLIERALAHEWVWRLLIGLAIAVLGLWLARWLARVLDRLLQRFDVDPILRNFLRNLGYALAVIVVLIAALDFAGVPTSSLLALLGAAGLAIGLGLKDSLSNIASGVMLIMLRPFHAGERVQIAGLEGVVDSVHIFHTRLHTADNREILLPNGQITSSPIINYSVMGQRRIDVSVGVSYDVDIDLPRQRLLALAADIPAILAAPAAQVIVSELGESSVVLQLRVWAPADIHTELRASLLERVLLDFRHHGIRIPGPQREIHLVQSSSSPPSRPTDP